MFSTRKFGFVALLVLALGIGMSLGAMTGASWFPEDVFAQAAREKTWSNADIKGRYVNSGEGVQYRTSSPPLRFAAISWVDFDGTGGCTTSSIVNVVVGERPLGMFPADLSWSAAPCTYDMRPDGTYTAEVGDPSNPRFILIGIVADNGNTLYQIDRRPGVINSMVLHRQNPNPAYTGLSGVYPR